MNVRRNFVTAAPSISRRETPNLRSPPILDEVSPCRPAIIMPQVNNKEDKDAVGNRQCDAEGDGRDLTGRQKADVKGKGEDLKLIESADDMPEFKDDQVTTEEEQVNLDLTEPPPPEVMEYARRELGETDEVKCQMLEEFRDMIYGNTRLGSRKPVIRMRRAGRGETEARPERCERANDGARRVSSRAGLVRGNFKSLDTSLRQNGN